LKKKLFRDITLKKNSAKLAYKNEAKQPPPPPPTKKTEPHFSLTLLSLEASISSRAHPFLKKKRGHFLFRSVLPRQNPQKGPGADKHVGEKGEWNGITPTLLAADSLSSDSCSSFPRVQPSGSVL
jgi:hypothetical protein